MEMRGKLNQLRLEEDKQTYYRQNGELKKTEQIKNKYEITG